MSSVKLLLAAAALGRNAYSKWQFRHIMVDTFKALGLIVTTIIMFCATVIGGFYAAYLALQEYYAMSPAHAALIISLAMAFVLLSLMLGTYTYLQRMRAALQPLPDLHISRVADAFLDGLLKD